MKISVIVPIFNNEKYLDRAINSLLSNINLDKLEIILIDDGSTDNSFQICLKYANKYKNIKVVHQENEGVSSARNKGLSMVTGQYYTFLDSDDWIEQGYLNKCIQILTDEDPDVLITPFKKIYSNKIIKNNPVKYIKKLDGRNILYALIGKQYSDKYYPASVEDLNPVCGKFYKTSKFQALKFDETISRSEDLIYNLEIFYNAKSCAYMGTSYYCYNRNNSNSTVSVFDSNLLSKFKTVYLRINDFILKNKLEDNCLDYLNNRIIFGLITTITNCVRAPHSIKEEKIVLNDEMYSIAFESFKFKRLTLPYKLFFKLCEWKKSFMIFILAKTALTFRSLHE